MQLPKLYRKRLIPLESVLLKNDRILYRDASSIVTAWNTIRPKSNLACGCSCYFMDLGFKVSRFYDYDRNFMFWYCDIIDTEYDKETDTYTFTDLLADVEVYSDGSYRILDLDELAEALRSGLLSKEQMGLALERLHSLLQYIYSGKFSDLTDFLLEKESLQKV